MLTERQAYHHGQLRVALLEAAEALLDEEGLASFSLRAVARRVGVSHAAPAHHFGDVNGLLAALAAEGFRRFLEAMRQAQRAEQTPRAMMLASGVGYLRFARQRPALMKLMFGDDHIRTPTLELREAGEAAYQHLAADLERVFGVSPLADPAAMARLTAAWSVVHGFVTLLNAGLLPHYAAMNDMQLAVVLEAMSDPLLAPLKPL